MRFPSGEAGEAANIVSADVKVAVLVVSTEEILEDVGGGEVGVERKCADQRCRKRWPAWVVGGVLNGLGLGWAVGL